MPTTDPFTLPFDEAREWFRRKLNIPTERWDELPGPAHARAFTSAGAMQADLLNDLRTMTEKAIAGQMDIREFRKQFLPLVEKYGWKLKGGGPGWRSDLIFRQNIQSAYQAGRWRQFSESGVTHLKYVHMDGQLRPRPAHVALHGTVLPRTDPFWAVNYPPQGFRCKCRAVPADREEIRDAGDAPKRPEGWENAADRGFNYNVGDRSHSYRALTEKFESLPPDIARQWMRRFVREPAYAEFIAGRINEDFPVAVLTPAEKAALGTTRQTIWFSPDSLAKNKGQRPERSSGHADLTLDDYRRIPDVVHKGEKYRDGATHVIVLERGDGSVYRAVLKKTRDGSDNYFLSLFRTGESSKGLKQVLAKLEKLNPLVERNN